MPQNRSRFINSDILSLDRIKVMEYLLTADFMQSLNPVLHPVLYIIKDKGIGSEKLITITSALVFAGGIAFAQEAEEVIEGEEMAAMDKEMKMEAPAPSVTLTGSAEFGVKNVDDSSMPEAETIQLIREYKVEFGSSGTTDGGILYGGGISINDTEDDDPHQSVGAAKVYVGGADGSWKVSLVAMIQG